MIDLCENAGHDGRILNQRYGITFNTLQTYKNSCYIPVSCWICTILFENLKDPGNETDLKSLFFKMGYDCLLVNTNNTDLTFSDGSNPS